MQRSSPHTRVDFHARPLEPVRLLALALQTVRPKQWLKNGLIFFGLVYSLQLTNASLALQAVAAFAAFCCISGAGYILNDIRDLELDRNHPVKRFRPIVARQLSVRSALVLAILLFAAGFGLAAAVGLLFVAMCAAYMLLATSYSLWLKHVVLIDSFAVAAGFVLRAAAGAVAVEVPISPWLYVCTALGSLVIVFGKRRSELVELEHTAGSHRPSLEQYTVEFLDYLVAITATASVMAYSLYTFSAENVPANHLMMATIPVVLYGVFRYLFLLRVKNVTSAPEELLLKDRSLAAAVVLVLAMSAAILYLSPRAA
ncbi:MAG: decaprenyl-phosphate phosphoribosyltransferase [Chloroflexi bacterium]|nr:decaprenyl-phosphate phosphoribosyltransferase [Chloroflexota bacterium]